MPCRKFHICSAGWENGWSGIDPEVSDGGASRTTKSSLGRKVLTCSSTGLNGLGFLGLLEFMKDLLACGEHFQNGRKAELSRSTVLCDFCRSQTALGLYSFICYQVAKRSWHVTSVPLCHPCYQTNAFVWLALTPEVQQRFTALTNELDYFHVHPLSFKEC